jgi:hypothetical protein
MPATLSAELLLKGSLACKGTRPLLRNPSKCGSVDILFNIISSAIILVKQNDIKAQKLRNNRVLG